MASPNQDSFSSSSETSTETSSPEPQLPSNLNVIEEGLATQGPVNPTESRAVQLPPLSLQQSDKESLESRQLKIGVPWLSGGFGIVYLATQNNSSSEVSLVCKVIEFTGLSHIYVRHLTKWKELKNANVMPVKEILLLKDPNRILVLMEMADFDLQELVLNQPFWVSKKLAAQYYHQLNRGLSYMHDRKFAHRNLKPRNLLINARDMELRISDCGMSRVSFASNHPESIASASGWHETYGYLAPEVFAGTNAYCPIMADMWSVGCILFFMLYKTRPFQSNKLSLNQLVTKQKHFKLSLTRRVEPPEEKDEGDIAEVKKVLVAHWCADPVKRPTSKQAMDDARFYNKWSNWWPTATPSIATWSVHFN